MRAKSKCAGTSLKWPRSLTAGVARMRSIVALQQQWGAEQCWLVYKHQSGQQWRVTKVELEESRHVVCRLSMQIKSWLLWTQLWYLRYQGVVCWLQRYWVSCEACGVKAIGGHGNWNCRVIQIVVVVVEILVWIRVKLVGMLQRHQENMKKLNHA